MSTLLYNLTENITGDTFCALPETEEERTRFRGVTDNLMQWTA
jgi:hypothetical protein